MKLDLSSKEFLKVRDREVSNKFLIDEPLNRINEILETALNIRVVRDSYFLYNSKDNLV